MKTSMPSKEALLAAMWLDAGRTEPGYMTRIDNAAAIIRGVYAPHLMAYKKLRAACRNYNDKRCTQTEREDYLAAIRSALAALDELEKINVETD